MSCGHPSDDIQVVSEEGSSSKGLQPPEEPSPPRVPNSMPVPAVPRRAAPPRRKAKSPAPPLEEASPIPSTTEEESPAAMSDNIVPSAAPAPVLEPAADREEHGLKPPSPPPVDAHVEPLTSEIGPVDLPKAMLGIDDKEDVTPAAVDMDKATSSIVDRDSDEDPPKATLVSVEKELEEPVAPAPASKKSDSLNSPEEPSSSFAKESTQLEVKAESTLQQPNIEVHEEEERAEHQTIDADVKTPSPISQRASVAIGDLPPPTVNLTTTSVPSDAATSPTAASLEEESPDPVVEPTEEEEEAARRARVAARLAKMGAVNPFAPPPQRKLSHDVVSPPPTSESTKPADESVTESSPIPRSPPITPERDEEVNIQKDISPELSDPSSPAPDTSKTQKETEDGKY